MRGKKGRRDWLKLETSQAFNFCWDYWDESLGCLSRASCMDHVLIVSCRT